MVLRLQQRLASPHTSGALHNTAQRWHMLPCIYDHSACIRIPSPVLHLSLLCRSLLV